MICCPPPTTCTLTSSFSPQPAFKGLTFTDLPLCLQLNIMQRLSDGRDLVSLGQVAPDLHVLSEDRLLWKKLCQYHFSERQVRGAPQAVPPLPSLLPPPQTALAFFSSLKRECPPSRASQLTREQQYEEFLNNVCDSHAGKKKLTFLTHMHTSQIALRHS